MGMTERRLPGDPAVASHRLSRLQRLGAPAAGGDTEDARAAKRACGAANGRTVHPRYVAEGGQIDHRACCIDEHRPDRPLERYGLGSSGVAR